MAGDWIKIRVDLFEDPSTLGIAARLKMEIEAVVGKLAKVWAWAGAHTFDGVIKRVSADTIDQIAGKPGFASAMEEVGWLRAVRGAVEFPNWERHNAECAKKRAVTARRVTRWRNAEGVTPGVTRAEAAESREREDEEQSGSSDHSPASGQERRPVTRTAEVTAADLNEQQREVCSSLLQLQTGTVKIFSPPDAVAIAAHPKANRRQVLWAVERLRQQVSRKRPIKNFAGYLRDLIENKDPPSGWVERYQKESLAEAILKESIEKKNGARSAASSDDAAP